MDFAALPPEVNSGLMYAGPGAGPLLAAASAWDALAAALESAAAGYTSEISALNGQAWSGPSSVLMAAAATPYVAWLQASAAAAAQTAAQAYAAAAAYEAAFAMTVPPPVIAANRAQLLALIATNFFGQNTAAIAATEAQYTEFWLQDVAAMYGYAAASWVASTLQPVDEPPRTTNPTGQVDQARAMTQIVGNTTSTRTQSLAQLSTQTTTSVGVDPPLPAGSSVNVAPGGAIVHVGVTVTVNNGYPVDFVSNAGNQLLVYVANGNLTYQLADGTTGSLGAGLDNLPAGSGMILSGTFEHWAGGSGVITVPGGSVTGTPGTAGGWVTETAGLATDLNLIQSTSPASASFFTTGPAVVTPVTPNASGALVAAPMAGSPGLAGTAGIQPQLNVEGLAEWARSVSGGDLAAELARAG